MRKSLFYLALLLVGCGGGGGQGDGAFVGPVAQPAQAPHEPEITALVLESDTALFMEGNGSVVFTAEITFRDAGSDLRALRVRMPDGTRIEFEESIPAETGTFSEDLIMSTQSVGTFVLEFWLVDQVGDRSNSVTAEFTVIADVLVGEWTNRLSGLPDALADVVWNGNVFIAVGGSGAIFTSPDGINWAAIDSGTDANLSAVVADGPHVVAVGREIIMLSTDHGASWTIKDRPEEAVLVAAAINSSQIVVGGHRWGWGTPITMISEDRGDSWRAVDLWPDENLWVNSLVYRDGIFVASTNSLARPGAWVTVSLDGKVWSEIAVSDHDAVLHTIHHDGSQFILGGSWGDVFASPDGLNWRQLQTPARDVFYTGAASNGSRLVLAGPWSCYYLGGGCELISGVQPVGLSSTDGGLSWAIFNIDGDYESWGLAWGNGRFVSVGRRSPLFSNEGAIYTAE